MTGASMTSKGERTQRVAAELRRLLAEEGAYRQRWSHHVSRDRDGGLNNLAIAKQLYLHPSHEAAGGDHLALKDRVRRALNGSFIAADTLRLFIDAFGITSGDAARLWNLYDPTTVRRDVVRGTLPSRSLGSPSQRITVSLIDEHFIGADRLPARHLTTQVVESNVNGLETLTLYTDTDEVKLYVEAGGTEERQPSLDKGFPAKVLIRFDQPLDKGDRTMVRYGFEFNYKSPPAPIFSRAARHALQNLFIKVQFHPAAVPSAVSWKVWADFDHTKVLHEKVVPPDDTLQVRHHLNLLEDAVAGFQWEW